MKLIEKLVSRRAEEIARSFRMNDVDWPIKEDRAFRAGYEEGFRKAREMAASEIMRFDESDDPGLLDAQVRVIELGEEEVDGGTCKIKP